MKRKESVLGKLEKDTGLALAPWVLFFFFLAVFFFLLLFQQTMHVSTKYYVQDGLAAAALAGEVVDLDVLSQEQELVITDLDYAKTVFFESLHASLQLSAEGYPDENSVYFHRQIPVEVTELTIYNVAEEQVYRTDLLHGAGQLQYEAGVGIRPDSRSILLGPLKNGGQYQHQVEMLDGERKSIKTTSLYAKIQFGVKGYDGNPVVLEKDILTDIQTSEGE